MSDTHDLTVLHDLIAAVRATPGAPEAAAAELEAEAGAHRTGDVDGPGTSHSVLEAAREALGGLVGRPHPEPTDVDAGGEVQRLAALMGRMETAMRDDRLSGPARDAVIRAFDPVKAARDAALQRDVGA